MEKIILKVGGMSCNHCKMAVEKALKEIDDVEHAQVDLGKKEVVVTGTASRDQLAKVITEAGYDVLGQ